MNEKRETCCCFTGHRPEKLQGSEEAIKEQLERAIQQAIDDGYTVFITGMAKGVDIWAAEIVLEKKLTSPALKLICAVPYKGVGLHWPKTWSNRFLGILHRADEVCYISQTFSYSAYQTRNIWMVDHSSRVIAVYHGTSGGTRNTIEYAKRQENCTISYCE